MPKKSITSHEHVHEHETRIRTRSCEAVCGHPSAVFVHEHESQYQSWESVENQKNEL